MTVPAVVAVSALPVNAPVKPVEEIDVAPVTTPASTVIVESRTIPEPITGVIFKLPVVELIVFESIVMLSTITDPAVLDPVVDNASLPKEILPPESVIEPSARVNVPIVEPESNDIVPENVVPDSISVPVILPGAISVAVIVPGRIWLFLICVIAIYIS